MKELPKNIVVLLEQNEAPALLKRHLTLVYNTAMELTAKLKQNWPHLDLNSEEIAFGSSTHDIGKVIERNELYEKGKKHESTGYSLLIRQGIPEHLARFTQTHADWTKQDLKIEDLLVALADKTWKGKRIHELEETLARNISLSLNLDYWEIYLKLDELISEITLGADKRLAWQNEDSI